MEKLEVLQHTGCIRLEDMQLKVLYCSAGRQGMRRVSAVLSVKRNWTTMPRAEDVGMNY
jgi:hypothetical protein